jgi:diguanylate cyclase (GGDEF)-like protein
MEEFDLDLTTMITDLPESKKKKKKAVLVVMTGPTSGRVVFLESKSTWSLGRSTENDLSFPEISVSRNHCLIEFSESGIWTVRDLGSSNGTWINGNRIETQTLKGEDKIQLGSQTALKFVYQDELESTFQKEIYDSATKDSLTGLHTKRYFLEHLEAELQYHRRKKGPLSIVIGDIDFFKKVNDTYGHLAGDFVLKETGKLLTKRLRKGDVGARYGGEELIFFLRDTNLEGALVFAEQTRNLIEEHRYQYEGRDIPITISLGCATFYDSNFSTALELIKAADEYLYQAKQSGRNRVCPEMREKK